MTGAALAHAYARSTRSPEWTRELCPGQACWWSRLIPAVHSACERLAWTSTEAGLMIRTTTVDRLEQQGPLAPIWLTMLPNQLHPLRQSLLDEPQSELR